MPRMMDLIRASAVPPNLVQSAAKGCAVGAPPGNGRDPRLSRGPQQALRQNRRSSRWRDGMKRLRGPRRLISPLPKKFWNT